MNHHTHQVYEPLGGILAEGRRLGDVLTANGLVTEEQLSAALREQKRTGKLLGTIFIDQGIITEKDLSLTLALQAGGTFIDIKTASFNPEALALIPEEFARKHRIVPVTLGNDMIMVAMVDAFDINIIDQIQKLTGRYVDVLQATESDILTSLDRCYGLGEEKEVRLDELIASAEAALGNQKDISSQGGSSL